MTKEAVEKIKAAEVSAEEIIRMASAEARESIADAKKDAVERQAEAERFEHDKMEKKLAMACEEAQRIISEKAEQSRHEALKIKADASNRLSEAVKLIIGGVVKKWQ